MPNFHENLKSILSSKKVSQRQLALNTGVKPQTVTAWLRGECFPSVPTLILICLYLDVSADDILGIPEKRKGNVNTYNNNGIHNGDVTF